MRKEQKVKRKMLVKCPYCGKEIPVRVSGRKRLNIPLKNVYESLQVHRSVKEAAEELGCSPSYIFGVLKTHGLKLEDVRRGKSIEVSEKQSQQVPAGGEPRHPCTALLTTS